MTANLIIIDDGQARYGVQRAALLSTLEAQGWDVTETRAIEPDVEDAYLTMSAATVEVPGYDVAAMYGMSDDDLAGTPAMIARPDLGGVWELRAL